MRKAREEQRPGPDPGPPDEELQALVEKAVEREERAPVEGMQQAMLIAAESTFLDGADFQRGLREAVHSGETMAEQEEGRRQAERIIRPDLQEQDELEELASQGTADGLGPLRLPKSLVPPLERSSDRRLAECRVMQLPVARWAELWTTCLERSGGTEGARMELDLALWEETMAPHGHSKATFLSIREQPPLWAAMKALRRRMGKSTEDSFRRALENKALLSCIWCQGQCHKEKQKHDEAGVDAPKGERSMKLRKVMLGEESAAALKGAREVQCLECPVFTQLRAAVKKQPAALTMLRALEAEVERIQAPMSRYLACPKSVYGLRYAIPRESLGEGNDGSLKERGLQAGPYACLEQRAWTWAGCLGLYADFFPRDQQGEPALDAMRTSLGHGRGLGIGNLMATAHNGQPSLTELGRMGEPAGGAAVQESVKVATICLELFDHVKQLPDEHDHWRRLEHGIRGIPVAADREKAEGWRKALRDAIGAWRAGETWSPSYPTAGRIIRHLFWPEDGGDRWLECLPLLDAYESIYAGWAKHPNGAARANSLDWAIAKYWQDLHELRGLEQDAEAERLAVELGQEQDPMAAASRRRMQQLDRAMHYSVWQSFPRELSLRPGPQQLEAAIVRQVDLDGLGDEEDQPLPCLREAGLPLTQRAGGWAVAASPWRWAGAPLPRMGVKEEKEDQPMPQEPEGQQEEGKEPPPPWRHREGRGVRLASALLQEWADASWPFMFVDLHDPLNKTEAFEDAAALSLGHPGIRERTAAARAMLARKVPQRQREQLNADFPRRYHEGPLVLALAEGDTYGAYWHAMGKLQMLQMIRHVPGEAPPDPETLPAWGRLAAEEPANGAWLKRTAYAIARSNVQQGLLMAAEKQEVAGANQRAHQLRPGQSGFPPTQNRHLAGCMRYGSQAAAGGGGARIPAFLRAPGQEMLCGPGPACLRRRPEMGNLGGGDEHFQQQPHVEDPVADFAARMAAR